MSELVIKIDDSKVFLILKKENSKQASLSWKNDNNLSRLLLVNLDKLLKKEGLKIEDVQKVKVDSNLSESYTSNRIANSVAKAIEWGTPSVLFFLVLCYYLDVV